MLSVKGIQVTLITIKVIEVAIYRHPRCRQQVTIIENNLHYRPTMKVQTGSGLEASSWGLVSEYKVAMTDAKG